MSLKHLLQYIAKACVEVSVKSYFFEKDDEAKQARLHRD